MLFNSYIFIFAFLPLTFFIYFYLNKKRLGELAKAFLVFASLAFYSWWNVLYLPLILTSMLVNFAIGRQLGRIQLLVNENPQNSRILKKYLSPKALLIFGIAFNLALLGYFKYTDFLILNLNFLGANFELLHLALPLAISFFTFQQIAYLVDSYRENTKEYDFLTYALFVSFFPQLIAGPIVHHKEMMPQFATLRNRFINYKNITLGLFIFSIGLFKKVVIADSFAIWATNGFDKMPSLDILSAWLTSLSYTFQLYFDFSGYCDMAIGAALLFNIKLPINFNSPYKSLNITEFWQKWHVTLGRFLMNYLYIPIMFSGARITDKTKMLIKSCAALFITFLLCGLWHGASWMFVFYGAFHGAGLVAHRVWQYFGFKMPRILAWFITFNFVNISFIFFRATSWDDAMKVLGGMFYFNGYDYYIFKGMRGYFNSEFYYEGLNSFVVLFVCSALILFFKNSYTLINDTSKHNFRYATLATMIFLVSALCMGLSKYTEFIYFNF